MKKTEKSFEIFKIIEKIRKILENSKRREGQKIGKNLNFGLSFLLLWWLGATCA